MVAKLRMCSRLCFSGTRYIDLYRNASTNNAGFGNNGFDDANDFVGEQPAGDDKCFGCGETG